MTILKIKPGSIMIWKEYNRIKRFIYTLLRKNLKYNRYVFIDKNIDLYFDTLPKQFPNYKILEPKKKYNKSEIDRLKILMELYEHDCRSIDIMKNIINCVREDTITNDTCSTLDELASNKYYKEVNDTSK